MPERNEIVVLNTIPLFSTAEAADVELGFGVLPPIGKVGLQYAHCL